MVRFDRSISKERTMDVSVSSFNLSMLAVIMVSMVFLSPSSNGISRELGVP